jgi:hypothetical protein
MIILSKPVFRLKMEILKSLLDYSNIILVEKMLMSLLRSNLTKKIVRLG